MTKITKSEKVPENMQEVFDMIVVLTDKFSQQYLNDEYAQLARYVTAALCRKRPSPLMSGYANVWACGIVYALGSVNFLFDKSQTPYMNATDLCHHFDVRKSTGASKSKVVRDTLKMGQFDPNWSLPSKLDNHPFAWTIEFDGFLVDARQLPRNIQEAVYQKGIVPYIPADRE